MRIAFVTGNEHKLREAKEILTGHEVVGMRLDLPEIQSLDPEAIIRAKLDAARSLIEAEALMVEDVSSYGAGTRLPGPFAKFFHEAIGCDGIVRFCDAMGSRAWRAECRIGLSGAGEPPRFFVGKVEGVVVEPRGDSDFGFDPIFVPEGSGKTFAEMSAAEKNAVSHRRRALEALKAFLDG